MAGLPLLDTNLILRHILGDHPNHSARATALFTRIARGQLAVRTTDIVVFEAVYALQRLYQVPRADIRTQLLALLELDGIVLPGKRSYRRMFNLYVANPGLSFADCFHAVLLRRLGLTEIVSFDRGFDRLPAVTRREPDLGGSW
jgi:predicted nucleic acid-binding protein